MEHKSDFRQRWLGVSTKVKIIVAIVLVLLVALIVRGFSAKNMATVKRTGNLKPIVNVITVQRGDMMKRIELTGQTVPESQVDITAKYAGKITEVNVELGQRVSPGQVLLVQDTGDVDIALRQNSASLRQADADAVESNAAFQANYQKAQSDYQYSVTSYQRYKNLYDQSAVSKEILDNAEKQMIAAKAAVDTWAKQITAGSAASVQAKWAARDKVQHTMEGLQNQKEDLVLRAPRAGVIGFRQAEVGAMAGTGQKLLTIVDNSHIYVDCAVSEQDVGQIVTGMTTNISIESLGKIYAGKVIYISPAMDTKTQSYTIRIDIENPDNSIRAGMFARAEISVLLCKQVLFVPKEAIVSLNGVDRIFVVDANNQVGERKVKLGLRNDKGVEIVSGINEGEQVAITNLARLKNGVTVTPSAAHEQ